MRLLLICVLALAAVPAAVANNSQPLAFFTSSASLSHNVSQQTGVTNPTITGAWQGCGWNAGDSIGRDAVLNSALAAGASTSDSVCVISDWASRVISTEIAANSPDLVLAVSFSTGGSIHVSPVFDKRLGLWIYRACVNAPVYPPGDAALQTISGSNGGVGVPTTVTLSVSNPTSKQIAKIRYDWGFFPGIC